MIFGDSDRAKGISKTFGAEVSYIIEKLRKADYWLWFINNIVNDLIKWTNGLRDSCTIPPNLFEKQKPFILNEIQFPDRNENQNNKAM